MRRISLSLVLLILIASSGCGPRFGTVEGFVTIDGKPANNGTVIFSNAGNQSAGGAIGPDGYYVVERVPVGEVRVAIHQMMTMGGGPDRPAGPLKGIEEPVAAVAKPVPIPTRYLNVETSDLRYSVASGSNEINIELRSGAQPRNARQPD